MSGNDMGMGIDIPDAAFEAASGIAPEPKLADVTPKKSGKTIDKRELGEQLHDQLMAGGSDEDEDGDEEDLGSKDRKKSPKKAEDGEEEDKPDTKVRKKAKPEPEAKEPAAGGKWKVKANGKEIEFDPSDTEATRRLVEKGLGANDTFEQAARMRKESEQIRKQNEELVNLLKKSAQDPHTLADLLANPAIGADFKQIAKDYVWQMIQEEQELEGLTPEQREWRQSHKRVQRLEQERAAREEAERSQREAHDKAQRQAAYEEEYEKKIMAALDVKGVPKTKHTVAKMAWFLNQAIENNRDVSAEDVAEYVLQEQEHYYRSTLDGMNRKQLAKLLGEKNLEKLRAYELDKLKSPTSNPFQKGDKNSENTAQRGSSRQRQDTRKHSSDWKEDVVQGFLAQFN